MRQYGCLHGNPWDSEREFRAAKARAIENREAQRLVDEQLEAEIDLDVYCTECFGPCRES